MAISDQGKTFFDFAWLCAFEEKVQKYCFKYARNIQNLFLYLSER